MNGSPCQCRTPTRTPASGPEEEKKKTQAQQMNRLPIFIHLDDHVHVGDGLVLVVALHGLEDLAVGALALALPDEEGGASENHFLVGADCGQLLPGQLVVAVPAPQRGRDLPQELLLRRVS